MTIYDIHTHQLQHNAIIAAEINTGLTDGYIYSIGHHPWSDPASFSPDKLLQAATDPRIVAIGETGLDTIHGADIETQQQIFLHHIDISEQLKKPLIIHCVRAHNRLIDIFLSITPSQPWIFHGFRLKPTIARQLLDAGIYLSLGPKCNPLTATIIPDEKLLIETDDDKSTTIQQVAATIAKYRNTTQSEILNTVSHNSARLLCV